MGYNISTIKNLASLSGYFFFLLGKSEYTYGRSGDALYHHFDEIANRIGADSAIIKSSHSDIVANELINSIKEKEWFSDAYRELLCIEPALVIMKPHPHIFEFEDSEIFAVISFKALDAMYSNEAELIMDIVDLSKDRNLNILKKAKKQQSGIGLLRRIRNSVILQPNFNGIGIDLRELFSDGSNTPVEIHMEHMN